MALPARHYAIGGFGGLLFSSIIGHWYGLILGIIFSYFSHGFIDIFFPEYWKRNRSEDIGIGATVTIVLIWQFIIYGGLFGIGITILMFIVCLVPDIVDKIREWLGYCACYSFHSGPNKSKYVGMIRDESIEGTIISEIFFPLLSFAIGYLTIKFYSLHRMIF